LPEFVRVGQVTAPFGVDGAVKVYPLTDFEDRFEPGSELYLDGQVRHVEWWRPGHPTVTVKLTGIDNRTLAELHRGRYLEVPEGAVKPLSKGSYYHHQLIGPANDVWVVTGEDRAEHLVPATKDAVLEVDLESRRVVIQSWVFDEEEVR